MRGVWGFDSETELIAAGRLAPAPACFSLADAQEATSLWHGNDREAVEAFLLQVQLVVGANTAYDMAVICARYPEFMEYVFDLYRDKKVVDVQLSEKLIDIARGQLGGYRDHRGFFRKKFYSVDALHQHYGYEELDKTTYRLGYGPLIQVPLEKWEQGAKDYATKDAIAHMRIYQGQREWSDYLADELNQPGPAFALHLMSCEGLRCDPEQVRKTKAELEIQIQQARVVCEQAKLVVEGKRKQQPAKDRLLEIYDSLGFEVPLTDTGLEKLRELDCYDAHTEYLPAKEIWSLGLQKYVKTDDTACAASGDDVLKAYSTFGAAKRLRTKMETLEKCTVVPFQTRYDPLINSGRTSSSKPLEPLLGDNIQNQDRSDITRKCFIPPPGYVFCSIDYNMAELVAWAQVCLWALGQSKMADVLNKGMDPHLDFLCRYLLAEPISYEDGSKRKKQKDKVIKALRQIAKGGNFGLPGGLGERTFHKYLLASGDPLVLEVLRTQPGMVKRARDGWFSQWDEANPYFDWVKRMCHDGAGTAVQFVSGRVRGLCTFSAMANTFFQGLTADAAKSALLPLARECYLKSENSVLYGSRPVAFIHDEVLIAIPKDRAHEAAYRARDIMVSKFQEYTPDVLVTAEPALMDRWTKSAEPAFDRNGNLIAWDPMAEYDDSGVQVGFKEAA